MSFAKVSSAQIFLIQPHIVDIEVDVSRGLHSFSIVGLPDKAVEEAADRIIAALKNSGFETPGKRHENVVISLAPASMKKEGAGFDLGIAVGYLAAGGRITLPAEKAIYIGELALNGDVRPVRGILPLLEKAGREGFTTAFIPAENAGEAGHVLGITSYPARSLNEVIEHIVKKKQLVRASPGTETSDISHRERTDMADVRGQETAKRGLEIAAAGGHSVGLYGPPGTGKTMLARAFVSIVPPLTQEEQLEVTGIHSIAGTLRGSLITEPPLRSPHHTSSYAAVIGGGTAVRPGEVTLAHRGILFLDEFPEFDRRVVESLRQPLEERVVSISRAKGSVELPAGFLLIAAMNPCPCGNYGFAGAPCTCAAHDIQKYKRKLSGPIMERIDIWLEVPRIDIAKLAEYDAGETSAEVQARVSRARSLARERLAGRIATSNASMSARDTIELIEVTPRAREALDDVARKMGISPRTYHKILRVARTIADLAGAPTIELPHVLEAIGYRPRIASALN